MRRFYLCIKLFVYCLYGVNSDAQNTFIENKGQFPAQVIAKVALPSGSMFIEKGGTKFVFYSAQQLKDRHDLIKQNNLIDAYSYRVNFLNSDSTSRFFLNEASEYYENYFIGDKSFWASGVRSFKSLNQYNIYDGIDIKYYISEGNLKFDFNIAPNANPDLIKIHYVGVNDILLNNGNLNITTSISKIIEHKPYAYQIINNVVEQVKCEYRLKENILSYFFPEGFDNNYNLIIDPILEFSTYSGSTTDNFGYTATYDNLGFLYSGSTAFGTGYPTTLGAYQINYANNAGGTDIAITKYDTSGNQRIFSTYLGGSLDDLPHSMIVNSSNELFVFGSTASSDFPTTSNAFQQNFNGGTAFSPSGIGVSFPNGSDLFVSRLSTGGGNLLASTFIGGSGNDGLNTAPALKYNYADEVRGEIDIDQQNNIYIATCTQSTDFPSKNGFQNFNVGGQEGCIIKMDNQLTSIIWSTFLGGSNADAIYSLAIDNNDDIYVTGGTSSNDFPTTPNVHQSIFQDSLSADGFISKVSTKGDQLLSSSYFGTKRYDQSYFVEIGSSNNIYLFGQTKDIEGSLIYNAPYYITNGGQFISVLNSDLTALIRSTTIGTGKGTPDISPTAFLVDVCDKVYISGWGSNLGGQLSTLNLPVSDSAFQQTTDGNDIYLMVLDDLLSSLEYATYFGGSLSNEHVDGGTSRFDKKGVIYQSVCAGCGGNSDFPIEPNPGAVSTLNNSLNCNNGVFKFNFDFPMVIADFDTDWIGCDSTLIFQNLTNSNSSVSYTWDFGDLSTTNVENPSHTYSQGGLFNVTLIATDNSTCNISDTVVKQIYILSNTSDSIPNIIKCPNEQFQIGLQPLNDMAIDYTWTPNIALSTNDISNPFCDTDSNIQYTLILSNGICTDTLFQNILVNTIDLDLGSDTIYCSDPILLNANFSDNINSILWSSNSFFYDILSDSSSLLVYSPDVFYIQVSDSICSQIDSIEVLPDMINIDIIGNDICEGDSTLIGVLNQNPTLPLISYNWNVNNLNLSDFYDSPEISKWYVVEVVSVDGCILKDSVYINVNPYPIIDSISISDTIIFRGETIAIQVYTEDKINWFDFNDNLNQVFIPTNTSCYDFEVYNNFGCSIQDSICIRVDDVFCDVTKIKIPNAFSPNNDGMNESYFITDYDDLITDFKLEIFNRLGQQVFYSDDINKKWNGSFKDKKLPPQVFHFYLNLKCIGGKQYFHKGNITLIR